MKFKDAETLSAYLDGQLGAADVSRLEARLVADTSLQHVLDDLRVAKGLLRRVPRRKAPRNFMLNALDPRVRAPKPRAVPVLAYAGALASVLFLLGIAVNSMAPVVGGAYLAAPAYGVGGGMGGGDGGASTQVEAPEQSLAMAPAATPELAAPLGAAAPAAEPLAKAAPPGQATDRQAQKEVRAPIPDLWLLVLAITALVLGNLSWYLDRYTRRRFRSRFLEK